MKITKEIPYHFQIGRCWKTTCPLYKFSKLMNWARIFFRIQFFYSSLWENLLETVWTALNMRKTPTRIFLQPISDNGSHLYGDWEVWVGGCNATNSHRINHLLLSRFLKFPPSVILYSEFMISSKAKGTAQIHRSSIFRTGAEQSRFALTRIWFQPIQGILRAAIRWET